MAECGYGYGRAEVVTMASEYAVYLEKRDQAHPLSMKWFRGFMSRWTELKVLKPRGLELQRAKSINMASVTRYNTELGSILDKYCLKDKPERVYNIDEKGLSMSHTPPSVVTTETKVPAVTSGSRTLITVIGCGNALGYSVPPYFVFPGARMRSELLEGGCIGADGTVSESGWSNSSVFRKYIAEHLMKYLPERSPDKPVLLLYDGHKSHINLGLIDWAREHNVILFILPAHTSHVLQLLDVGCFGPFERIYNSVCHQFMRENCGKSITRYNVCNLGCQAYAKALSASNLQASFRKTGIHPYNPSVVDASHFKPSEVLHSSPAMPAPQSDAQPTAKEFFKGKVAVPKPNDSKTIKRKYLSTIVSGRAITEDSVLEKVRDHEQSKHKKKSATQQDHQPGPSGSASQSRVDQSAMSESDQDDSDTDVCCVCNLFTPVEVHNSAFVVFVKWVQCDKCEHWVHLIFCTQVRVVRRGDKFLCPHCATEE
ncbi:uncharacterized protein LOC127880180 [Dreissena polymorpha]|uniref:uncharacterized protein LOC127880180 n=1 Tax=Dreissena polymorpha TaxID=45954 RepID=UPI0022649326|nr:uncharacterized protein LOC127880180 [Dreissena polymorpha]